MQLQVLKSTTKDGIMSSDKKYFPNLKESERKMLYESTLRRFLQKVNLSLENSITISDKNKEKTSRVVTKNIKKIKERIVILKSSTPNLAVLVETTDDPVIIASAKTEDEISVCAIALGTIENIDSNILHEMIETLIKETNAAPFEMTFYITACPSKESYILENIDRLTNNSIWKNTYEKKKKKYYLDIRYAIFNQLISEIVDPNNIYFDSTDTVENKNYYSNFAQKLGKNIVAVVYKEES